MRVSVLTPGGNEVAALDLAPDCPVPELKRRLAERIGAAPSRQRLLHGGVALAGGRLEDAGVGDGATLTLVLLGPGRILTACEDGAARLFDADTLECIQTFRGHEMGVRSAVFSPDGASVLTASEDRTARLWSAEAGECTSVLGHEGAVNSAAFSPW